MRKAYKFGTRVKLTGSGGYIFEVPTMKGHHYSEVYGITQDKDYEASIQSMLLFSRKTGELLSFAEESNGPWPFPARCFVREKQSEPPK